MPLLNFQRRMIVDFHPSDCKLINTRHCNAFSANICKTDHKSEACGNPPSLNILLDSLIFNFPWNAYPGSICLGVRCQAKYMCIDIRTHIQTQVSHQGWIWILLGNLTDHLNSLCFRRRYLRLYWSLFSSKNCRREKALEMTKSRWRESIRCLGSSHTDQEKDEQLRKTKLGIYFSPKKPPLQYYWRLWNSAIEAKRMQIRALLPAQYFPDSRPLWYTRPELPSSSASLFHKLGTMG